jgi:hypothetical protein
MHGNFGTQKISQRTLSKPYFKWFLFSRALSGLPAFVGWVDGTLDGFAEWREAGVVLR